MLTYEPISALGTRDVAVSFANALEVGEVITAATVVSSDPAVLAVSNEQVNTVAIDQDNVQAGIGQAVTFSIAGQVAGTNRAQVTLTIDITGSSGTKEKYKIRQPIKPALED